jgi:hypothetical protein
VPEQRCRQTGVHAVPPASLGPPSWLVVAALFDELQVSCVAHRSGVDGEGVDLHGVCRPLVVQRPRLGRGAHGERPGRDDHLGRQRRGVGRRWRWLRRVQHRATGPKLVGGQHGLVVLLLVLHDHAEREGLFGEPAAVVERRARQHVEHLLPHGADIAARLGRVEQRQRRAVGASVPERVVEVVDVGTHRFPAADIAHEPELLLVADVGQVPHQRRHQRRVLPDQVVLVNRRGEQLATGPGAGQLGGNPVTQPLGLDAGGHGTTTWSPGCSSHPSSTSSRRGGPCLKQTDAT